MKEAGKRQMQECKGGGNAPHFLQVLISGDFKSNDFASADSRGFAKMFFVCAHSEGFASADVRESVTVLRIGSAKLLAGITTHVTWAGIIVNGKLGYDKRKCAKRAKKSPDNCILAVQDLHTRNPSSGSELHGCVTLLFHLRVFAASG